MDRPVRPRVRDAAPIGPFRKLRAAAVSSNSPSFSKTHRDLHFADTLPFLLRSRRVRFPGEAEHA